jgi:hypothetical protein
MAIQDGLAALITYLKAQSAISSALGTRVFGLELPESETDDMPRKAIVCNLAGGMGYASYIDVYKLRIDFYCYGETPYEASEVWRTLKPILRDMEKNVTSSTCLMSAVHSGGATFTRESVTEWSVVIDSWLVEFKETIVS